MKRWLWELSGLMILLACASVQSAPPTDSVTQSAASRQDSTSAAKREAHSAKVLDRLDLDTSRITGTRELPKVMAIVPWKSPEPETPSQHRFRTMVDDALAPVDRSTFRREVGYFDALSGGRKPVGTAEMPQEK